MNRSTRSLAMALLGSALAFMGPSGAAEKAVTAPGTQTVIDIGDRRELFVDDFLIDKRAGVELRLHSPTPREIVMVRNAPWDGAGGAAITVFHDGDRFRMYYDTFLKVNEDGSNIRTSGDSFMCYAESKDGIRWTKPDLGLVAFEGSKKNNIVLRGSFDTSVFKDANPVCPSGERYKMVQGVMNKGLFAYKSADGLSWLPMSDKPFIAQKPGIPMFDTQNLVFWDPIRKHYWAYYRGYFSGRRDIFVSTSPDFVNWTEGKWLEYGDSPKAANEQLYTIQVLPYPRRAPHLFVGFPARYVERGWYPSNLTSLPDPQHRKNRMTRDKGGIGEPRFGKALSDGLFMTSRDGRYFHRWGEAFLRPGIERKVNWVYGDCFQNWGIIETASADPHAPPEFSFFAVEDYWRTPINVRRYTLRIDGFASLHAPHKQGEVLTKPLVFKGKSLSVNFSTSAVGNIKIELLDENNKRIPGYTLNDCEDLFGDSLERTVGWVKSDVSQLTGKPVRLRIVMRDANLYSFRFASK